MATDDGIYATDDQITQKAGANVSSAAVADAFLTSFILQAENFINVATRKVWAVDDAAFAALPATVKSILTEVASNIAAMYCIQYDMSGFTSRAEAETMLDVLNTGVIRGLAFLRKEKHKTFMDKAT